MGASTTAAIIAVTYGGLSVLWVLTLPPARRAFLKNAPALEPGRAAAPAGPHPLRSAVGTLAVFLANIATLGLFLAAAVWPDINGFLDRVRIPLSLNVRLAGAFFFLLNGIWGLLAVIVNPAYTPFFLRRKGKIFLATRSPYAIVRHPRYASEAALNMIFFLFTGCWIPLLGTLGWSALRAQAASEEEFLLHAAPEAYGRYLASTGRFLPWWKFRKEDLSRG
jgi:protein-S-isoprenylcysteine O-methyltransferase Ste14